MSRPEIDFRNTEDYEVRQATELAPILEWGVLPDPYVVTHEPEPLFFLVWRSNQDGTYSAVGGWKGATGCAFAISWAAERTENHSADAHSTLCERNAQ